MELQATTSQRHPSGSATTEAPQRRAFHQSGVRWRHSGHNLTEGAPWAISGEEPVASFSPLTAVKSLQTSSAGDWRAGG